MERRRVRSWWLLLVTAVALGWTACGDDDGDDRVVDGNGQQNSCVVCHLDQAALQLLAVEQELPEDTGEG